MTSIGTRIVSGAIWTAAETWGREAAVFIVFIILARLLGPGAIGLAALAMSVPLVLSIPVVQGIPDALIQRPEIDDAHADSAFWFLVSLGAALTGLVWAGSGLIAAALGEPALVDLVRWTSLIVLIKAVAAVPSAMLRRALLFRLFAIRTMIGTVSGGVIGIAMALQGFGVWSLVAMFVGRAAIECLFIFLGGQWWPRFRFSWARCRELFGFAGPVVVQSFVRVLNDEIPKLAIGTFLSPAAVGIYTLARKPVDLLANVLINPINLITMPVVSRIQNDHERISRFFDTGIRFAPMLGFPAFTGFAAIAPIVVPMALGDEWLAAVLAVQILMFLGLQRSIDGICAHLILAMGHARLLLALHLAYTGLGAVFFSLAAQISLEATVIAVVACNYALLPVFLFKVRDLARIEMMRPLQVLPRIALATALMYLTVEVAKPVLLSHLPPLPAVILCVATGAAVYAAAAFLLLRHDLLMARNILRRLKPSRAVAADLPK